MNISCPACAVSMHEGYLLDHGQRGDKYVGTCVAGVPEFSFFGNAKNESRRNYLLQAFRGPDCGLVQLYALKGEPS